MRLNLNLKINKMEVTKEMWRDILNTMKKYNRTDGYVDFLNGKLTFFDSNPEIDGVKALSVTREQVEEYSK